LHQLVEGQAWLHQLAEGQAWLHQLGEEKAGLYRQVEEQPRPLVQEGGRLQQPQLAWFRGPDTGSRSRLS
jgi:hypothetical protein